MFQWAPQLFDYQHSTKYFWYFIEESLKGLKRYECMIFFWFPVSLNQLDEAVLVEIVYLHVISCQ